MTVLRRLHREKNQAIVLGAALAATAGNDPKERAPCGAPRFECAVVLERPLNCATAPR